MAFISKQGLGDVGCEEGCYVGVAGEVGKGEPQDEQDDKEDGADGHPYVGAFVVFRFFRHGGEFCGLYLFVFIILKRASAILVQKKVL